VSNARSRAVVLTGRGWSTVAPAPDLNGTAGFDYTVSDGSMSDIGHVTITVTAVNDAPVAVDDTGTTAEDVAVTFSQADLKGNDTDVDNSNAQLSVTAVSSPLNGAAVQNAGGTVTCTPATDINGTEGFNYTVSDAILTVLALALHDALPVYDAPVAVDDTGTTAEDVAVTFSQADLKGNDTDVDNSNAQLSVTAVSSPLNG